VYAKRAQGKLVFFDLKADGVKVQVMADARNFGCGVEGFPAAISAFKRGDIVGVNGFPGALEFLLFLLLAVCVCEREREREREGERLRERERGRETERVPLEKTKNSLPPHHSFSSSFKPLPNIRQI
jgi:hypothetical protein